MSRSTILSGKRFSGRFPGLAVLLAVMLVGGVVVTMTATAADPANGTVTPDDRMFSWIGEEFADADNGGLGTGYGQANAQCLASADAPGCDHFSLTVEVPTDHWQRNQGGAEITIMPEASPAGEPPTERDDFNLYVYKREAGGAPNPVPVGQSTAAGEDADRVTIPEADGEYLVVVQARDVTDSGYNGGVLLESRPNEGGDVPQEPLSNKPCVNGKSADLFPCKGFDLASFLPREELGTMGSELNDIWGWVDPETKREYAIVGQQNGTSFVDVTDPFAPRYLGRLNTGQGAPTGVLSIWRDIKVYANHAFIGSEEPNHGMQVFDLRQLREVAAGDAPVEFTEDLSKRYSFIGRGTVTDPAPGPLVFTGDNSHNMVVNEESGIAYAVGTSTCNGGGLHMIDLGEPDAQGDLPKPEFAGCVTENTSVGSDAADTGESYVHDAQCVNYTGPDQDHVGDEICFNSSQDTLTIVKVDEADTPARDAPVQLSRTEYEDSAYSHQGWLTADGKHFLLDDELDEQETPGVSKTQTYVFNVEDLDQNQQQLVNTHEGTTESIDHNQYVLGNLSYQSNYRSGLRVLDVSNPRQLREVGFFDVFPKDNAAEFNGTWSNYPYFPSGNIIVSGIEQGLFVLRASGPATSSTGSSGAGSGGGAQQGSSAPAKRLGRLRAGFGRHTYGRVRSRTFPVQCRVRGTGTRRCLIKARYKARGRKARTIGSGRATLPSGRRSKTVRVKLNRVGRRLLARKPRGIPVRLALSAREVSSPRRRATNSRNARLRPISRR